MRPAFRLFDDFSIINFQKTKDVTFGHLAQHYILIFLNYPKKLEVFQ